MTAVDAPGPERHRAAKSCGKETYLVPLTLHDVKTFDFLFVYVLYILPMRASTLYAFRPAGLATSSISIIPRFRFRRDRR